MPSLTKSPEEQAIELIAPRKFHQIFTLPATGSHGPLKVTYSICGKEDGADTPTIVFCGGMFGGRWQAPFQNWLAEREGIRIIFIDRPEFGGSTAVPVQQRIPIFLETVSALLKHLHIEHVSIASHSAGTLYALNLLDQHPELLSPANPSITLCSPWVHQSISGATLLSAAAMLPNSLLNHWSSLTGFVINSASPTFAASGGFLGSFGSMLGGKDEGKENAERACLEGFGIGLDVKKELEKLVMKYAFEEGCTGANDEVRLCLKSVSGVEWGSIDDYPSYLRALKENWERKVAGGSQKLKVRILLSEKDIMIGEQGRKHIEDVWTEESCGKGVDLECVVVEGTDHDSIVDPSKGVMGEIYAALKEPRPGFT